MVTGVNVTLSAHFLLSPYCIMSVVALNIPTWAYDQMAPGISWRLICFNQYTGQDWNSPRIDLGRSVSECMHHREKLEVSFLPPLHGVWSLYNTQLKKYGQSFCERYTTFTIETANTEKRWVHIIWALRLEACVLYSKYTKNQACCSVNATPCLVWTWQSQVSHTEIRGGFSASATRCLKHM